jgi:hypothetical protein
VDAGTDPHAPSSARAPRKIARIPSPVPSELVCFAPLADPPADDVLQSAMPEQFSAQIPRRCIV